MKEKLLSNRVLNIRLALGIHKNGGETVIIGPERSLRNSIITGRYDHRNIQHFEKPKGNILLSACEMYEANKNSGIESLMLSSLNNLGSIQHYDQKRLLDGRFINFQNPLYSFFDYLYHYGVKTGYNAFQDSDQHLFDRIGNICDFGENTPFGSDSLIDNWDCYYHSDYCVINGFDNARFVISDTKGVGNIIQFAVDNLKSAHISIEKDLSTHKYSLKEEQRKEVV